MGDRAHDSDIVRVGVAKTSWRRVEGPREVWRRDVYGIFRVVSAYGYDVSGVGSDFCQYEGYEERDELAGSLHLVGTAIGGPGWTPPVHITFHPGDYTEVRYLHGYAARKESADE